MVLHTCVHDKGEDLLCEPVLQDKVSRHLCSFAGSRVLKGMLIPLSALVAVTAASGAFVAGMDAGRVFNTFPTMNGEWFPSEYFGLNGWRNFFENTAAVQFNHR